MTSCLGPQKGMWVFNLCLGFRKVSGERIIRRERGVNKPGEGTALVRGSGGASEPLAPLSDLTWSAVMGSEESQHWGS